MRNWIFLLAVTLAACGGGGGNGGNQIPPVPDNVSPGGLWAGERANGTSVVFLITETGEMRNVDEFGNQGFGPVTIANINELSSDWTMVPMLGRALFDGSDSADCSATGTVVLRQSIEIDPSCTTSMGTDVGGPFTLNYDPAYDTDSSLATIAGDYDDDRDVLTIDANGVVFEQSAATGCVFNGQVSIIDADWNLYAVQFMSESCVGERAVINGASWDGLTALVDDPMGGQALVVAVTADVGGQTVSLPALLPRIP